MQLNVIRGPGRILRTGAKTEVIMTQPSEPRAGIFEQSAADATEKLSRTNKRALDFVMGAQKLMLEETAFAANEMLERAQTETHLFSEFISKMAGSHSVKDLKTMLEECGQHQIDFVRRDSERVFRHGERMLEAASRLFNPRSDS
jgi:hypothetical protein